MSEIAEHICTYVAARERLQAELAAAQARILELRDEVAILRLYGNKDCTSMADAVLAEMRKGESDAK